MLGFLVVFDFSRVPAHLLEYLESRPRNDQQMLVVLHLLKRLEEVQLKLEGTVQPSTGRGRLDLSEQRDYARGTDSKITFLKDMQKVLIKLTDDVVASEGKLAEVYSFFITRCFT